MRKKDNKSATVIEPDLSYRIVGILFKVHSELGPGHHERFYQKACEEEFKQQNINYKRELKVPFEYKGKSIGRYFLDFLIDGKVVLELKNVTEVGSTEVGQVLRYLRKTNKKLGIIANLGKPSLEYKRIVNNEIRKNSRPQIRDQE